MELERISALRRDYKRMRILYFVYLLGAVVSVVALLTLPTKLLPLIILGCTVVYYLLVARPVTKSYQRAYVHVCAQYTLEKYLDEPSHTAESPLEPQVLRALRLIPAGEDARSLLLAEGGIGTWKGRDVRLGDATFAYLFTGPDGKKHHQVMAGCWVQVAAKSDTGLDLRLLPPSLLGEDARQAFLAACSDLEHTGAGGKAPLDLCTILKRPGSPDLPPQVISPLRHLLENARSMPAVCVQGNALHVFLPGCVLGRKVGLSSEPVDEMANCDLLPELSSVLALAEALDRKS